MAFRPAGLLAWLALLLSFGASSAQDLPRELRLTRKWSQPIEAEARVRAIAMDGSARILVLDGSTVVLVSESDAREVGNFDLLRPVGMALRGDRVQLVDAKTHRLLATDLVGRVAEWSPVTADQSGSLIAAGLTRCGWMLAFEAGDAGPGQTVIVILSPDGSGSTQRSLDIAATRMTVTGRWAVLTEPHAPFRMVAVNCDDLSKIREYDSEGLTADPHSGSWRALSGFVVGTYVLQTRTDLTSDRRRFLLFDFTTGRFWREVELVDALTLLAATCAGEVAGLRRGLSTTVVVYQISGASTEQPAC